MKAAIEIQLWPPIRQPPKTTRMSPHHYQWRREKIVTTAICLFRITASSKKVHSWPIVAITTIIIITMWPANRFRQCQWPWPILPTTLSRYGTIAWYWTTRSVRQRHHPSRPEMLKCRYLKRKSKFLIFWVWFIFFCFFSQIGLN